MVLQSPDDFVATIRQGLKPSRGRPVFADILHGTWDWQQFFDDLRFNVSDIAATYHHPIVCFSKRFLQLRDLPKLNLPGWDLEVPALFKDTARHPRDVVRSASNSGHRISLRSLLCCGARTTGMPG